MALFKVMVEGENFPSVDNPDITLGFFATRVCEAPTQAAAEAIVLQSVRDEYCNMLSAAAEASLHPKLRVVDLEQIAQYPDAMPSAGATWFPM